MDNVPERFSLSPKACQGILRRAEKRGKKLPFILGIIAAVLGVLGIFTTLGATFPWLTVGIPAIPSLYFDWFGGCIQAFIFCTLTTLFIKQAAGD